MNGENRVFRRGCQGKSDRTTFQPSGMRLERRRQALQSVADGSRWLLVLWVVIAVTYSRQTAEDAEVFGQDDGIRKYGHGLIVWTRI